MKKLTESEIYIIDSLFERKQIDKQRLIKAISILPEKLIGDVLNSLTEGIVNITSSNIKEPISTYILKDTPNKFLTIKEIKDFYNIGIGEAKDIVDGIPSVLDTTLRVGNEVIDKSKTLEFQNFILRLKDIRMWVARDKDNQLYLYRDKPTKGMASDTIVWLTTSFNTIHIDSDLFPSVKWEDKEPTRVTVRLA